MITKSELLKACFGETPDESDPRIELALEKHNIVRAAYGKPMYPSCFGRSVRWDKAKGRNGKSMHCELRAIDYQDTTGELARWCLAHLDLLAAAGLWLEDPLYTRGWVHLDDKERKNRVFVP